MLNNSSLNDIAMRQLYALLVVAALIGMSSCSSSRNTQSSDDPSYSSGKSAPASNQGQYYSTPNDNYVSMKATDPRFATFDDYDSYDSYYAPTSYAAAPGIYPSVGVGYGMGYPFYPSYGMGFSYGLGFGYGDPFFMDNYFLWNSWYNPYFYNPYYGGGLLLVKSVPATGFYGNLRPFNSVAYNTAMGRNTTTGSLYRPGMTSTSAYNKGLAGSSNANSYRSANGYRSPSYQSRSYSPSFGGSGGGFRSGGGFGGRH
jgi:hypothetical protein